ncbi:efflux RND transporter periplasmic adaptor subunit [Penaeicola halotolerans]|uniref:efflux RND transporter periplasmic adaptor subunit n=1 Tax=Penaeicola halotolerans TaxID=2793196 RepID=UPI001CF8B5C5|nr:efflux RND transporter periplasmic adaptor subunit [Penaeicola halotolerans]
MKNKNWIIYIGLLAIGLLLGKWMFSSSSENMSEHTEHAHEEGATYTCSMHPQIRQNEPGLCPLCGMELTKAGSQTASFDPFITEMTAEAVALANVQTTKVGLGEQAMSIQLSGKVQIDETSRQTITANFPGRIDRLLINFTGETVRTGNVLGSIYSPELVTAQKELLEAQKSNEQIPGIFEASKEKLRRWKISENQINEIIQTGEIRTQFSILATRSGVVINRLVSEGDYVNTGTPLYEVANLKRLWVIFDAYETDLPMIKKGSKISFTTPAVPGRSFTGVITFVDPLVNPNTRTVAVRASIDNTEELLKPEMFLEGEISTSANTQQKQLQIPKSAVLWTGKQSIVYVKQDAETPTFQWREITIGPLSGNYYQVIEGLEAGEEIVSNGTFAIDAAAQLNGHYSMMNKPAVKTIEVSDTFKKSLTSLTEKYFDLQKNLVASDVSAAQKSATATLSELSKVPMKAVEGEAHDQWMSIEMTLKQQLNKVIEAKNISDQRVPFEIISEQFIELVGTFGIMLPEVYSVYCPMAFDNKGAYWLTKEKEVLNPYFGDQMLTCGEIKKTYKKGQTTYGSTTNQSNQSTTHQH